MARPFKDFSGTRKGFLNVLERVGTKGTAPLWRCQCDCGNVVDLPSPVLYGTTKSCGCQRSRLIGEAKTIHGKNQKGNRSRIYKIWVGMRARCQSPSSPRYSRYGARGIAVCERWEDFTNFYADMGDPPSDKHTLDRIDNDGNYEPANCRWATHIEQWTNKSGGLNEAAVRFIKANPQMKVRELASRFNVGEHAIYFVRQGRTWKHVT